MTIPAATFRADLDRRAFYADALDTYFRAHPLMWIPLPTLLDIGGPSWRSRIACDLRKKRQMTITWNRDPLQSAYMFIPYVPLGRSADVETSGQRSLW